MPKRPQKLLWLDSVIFDIAVKKLKMKIICMHSSMIPFWGNIANLGQNRGNVLILVMLLGKHNFLPISIQIHGQKNCVLWSKL